MRMHRFSLVTCLLVLAMSGYGQSVLTLEDLMKMAGKSIGKGSNTNPVGAYAVKSYHVEELTLTAPVLVDGQTVNATRAWRVSITGGPFPVRSQAAVISVGGTALRTAVENEQLSEIVAITFSDAMLTNGAAITLSYGEETTEVPEKFNRGNN